MSKRAVVDQMLVINPDMGRGEADSAVDVVFEAVKAVVDQGEDVQIRGFGSFRLAHKKGRVGRNPRTGESIDIPARHEMKFKLPRKGG